MRSIGLLRGDVVVLENGVQPRPGDVVAALVDGASVLRVYAITLGRPMLRTADGHGTATRADDVVVQGVLVQLLRSRVGWN
jgi:repressor LexA